MGYRVGRNWFERHLVHELVIGQRDWVEVQRVLLLVVLGGHERLIVSLVDSMVGAFLFRRKVQEVLVALQGLLEAVAVPWRH